MHDTDLNIDSDLFVEKLLIIVSIPGTNKYNIDQLRPIIIILHKVHRALEIAMTARTPKLVI